MVNYNNGKVYMIESLTGGCRYYGSTTQHLSKRMAAHRNYMTQKNFNYISSKEVIIFGDAKIFLVENCPCKTKEELLKKEGEYIRNNECVNKQIAGRTPKEYREENKEQIQQKLKEYYSKNKEQIQQKSKEYREENKEQIQQKSKEHYSKNKEHINQKSKEHYEENKEHINQKSKEHYENNKEHIKQKSKEYREENKENIKQYYEKNKEHINQKAKERGEKKVLCECGVNIRKDSMSKHKKSKKHLKFVEQQE